MKIGIDARFYGPKHAGLGRYTQSLVDWLAKIDQANDYVIFLHRSNFDEFQTDNPRFQKRLVKAGHYSVKEQLELPGLLRNERLDLVHFPHLNVPVGYRGDYVVTIHDLIMHTFKNAAVTTRVKPIYEAKHLGYRLVTRLAATRAKRVIVPSEAVKHELMDYYHLPLERIAVTYEAGDELVEDQVQGEPSTSFDAAQDRSLRAGKVARRQGSDMADRHSELVSESETADNAILKRVRDDDSGQGSIVDRRTSDVLSKYDITKPFIMYVGNVYPHKNIELLARALGELHQKYGINLVLPSARSVFLERTEGMMKRHGVREFAVLPGFVPDDDLSVLYKEAVAYVFPSLAEGFGLPPLAAMTAGCPVLCSDIPVLREVCGDAARYFDPHDPQAVVREVSLLMDHPEVREQLIVEGHARTKKFSWKKMAEETLEVYREVVGK